MEAGRVRCLLLIAEPAGLPQCLQCRGQRLCKQHGDSLKPPSDITDLMRYRVGWMSTCCVPLLGSDDFQLTRTPIEHGRTEVYLMSQLRVFSIDDIKPMKVYKRSMINWRG